MYYTITCDNNIIYDPREMSDIMALNNVKYKQDINSAGSLSFEMEPTHRKYNSLKPLKSLLRLYRDNICIWIGRIVQMKKTFRRTKQITCEGALAFLHDIQIPPVIEWSSGIIVVGTNEYSGTMKSFLTYVLSEYNQSVAESRNIHLGNINTRVEEDGAYAGQPAHIHVKIDEYCSCYDAIFKAQEALGGGYFSIRVNGNNIYLDFDEEIPAKGTKNAIFGINLTDLTEEFSLEESFANCIIPLGKKQDNTGKRVNISSLPSGPISGTTYTKTGIRIYDQESINTYGRQELVVIEDHLSSPSELLIAGRLTLDSCVKPLITISAKFIDMNYINPSNMPVNIFDQINIYSTAHGYITNDTTPLLGFELDLNNPSNNKYTISMKRTTTLIDYFLKK